MRALFRRVPEARIKTALADYRGSDDFERSHRETFGSGNEWNLAYGQACTCETTRDRLEELRTVLRSESISYGELAELQGLADQIEPGDVELLEAAGVPEHEVRMGTLTPSGLVNVRTIRQSDLLACPHVILSPEHYRDDGSCRCDDPTEQARLVAEYDYQPSDFVTA